MIFAGQVGNATLALPTVKRVEAEAEIGQQKEVPRAKITNVIFSRLETPANLTRINNAPATDSYLASLLRKQSSFAEARQKCGI